MAVLVAGVVVINRDTPGEAGLSALPGATGQPPPTGPTGGSGGGSGGAPPFPMQPPDMPSGPPNGYNSGSYPAPDQGNGISIYNSGAPQSPSGQDGSQQAPNYPQQLQPANGSQPPDYDAPLQTAAQPSVSVVPSAPQQQPQQAQPSQGQQSQSNDQNQRGDEDSTQRQQQCQQAADFYQVSNGSSVWKVGAGAGGSMTGGRPTPGRDLPGLGQCNCAPEQAGPQKHQPTQDDGQKNQCGEQDDDAGADTSSRNNEVLVATSDSQGRLTILRRGYWDPTARSGRGRGYGYDKIYHKHGLTNLDSIYALIGMLKDPVPCGGSAIKYTAPINVWECDKMGLGCDSEHIADLEVIVETVNAGETDGLQKGIITMYCVGSEICPQIMNTIPRNPGKPR
ncbi:hypothetical protein [Mycolicibacterium sp. HS_4_1]